MHHFRFIRKFPNAFNSEIFPNESIRKIPDAPEMMHMDVPLEENKGTPTFSYAKGGGT